ncbi:MAG: hypothetical protein EOO56_00870 [Hymenobacter sp.]|nr:MAG: hypothetical protein EOO56_00870 [Hymenobacter sp.]
MTQEDLARRMHSVVYAQRKLAYLQEKLQELQLQSPVVLLPNQRSLSAVDVEVATQYELLLHGASAEIILEESAVQQQTDSLLTALPALIKDLIRQGWPLIAHWPADGILSLALVYQDEKFSIVPDNEVPLLLTSPARPPLA